MAQSKREYQHDRSASEGRTRARRDEDLERNGRSSSRAERDGGRRSSAASHASSSRSSSRRSSSWEDEEPRGRGERRRASRSQEQRSGGRRGDSARHASTRELGLRERGADDRDARRGRRTASSSGFLGNLLMSLSASQRDRRLLAAIAVTVVVIIVLAVLLAISTKGCSSSSVTEEEEETAQEETQATVETISLASTVTATTIEERLSACALWTVQSALDFADIVDMSGVNGFDLSGDNETPTVSLSNLIALAEALAPYEEAEVPYGFLIMDLETGLGFSCNLDEVVYGASSFKAAFCTFVAQTYLDTGEYSLASTVAEIDVEGAEGTTYSSAATLSELFSSAIVYSNNETYLALRALFSDDDLAQWLESLGVDGSLASDTHFPHYTTRAAAALWLTIYQYWQTDSAIAAYIEECCSETETSFLRDALEAAGYDVTVYDKAGWNIDGDASDGVDYNAICDNGIVTYNGRDYLVCVMLGASYSEATLVNAENLMAAVFALIEDLA